MLKTKPLCAAISASVLALTMAACGGDDADSAYCESVTTVADKYQTISDISPEDPEKFKEFTSSIEDIAADAPGDIKSEWDVIVDGLNGVVDGSITEEEGAKADASMQKAEKHAKDECDVDIS